MLLTLDILEIASFNPLQNEMGLRASMIGASA